MASAITGRGNESVQHRYGSGRREGVGGEPTEEQCGGTTGDARRWHSTMRKEATESWAEWANWPGGLGVLGLMQEKKSIGLQEVWAEIKFCIGKM
jgi:hypothetical protein